MLNELPDKIHEKFQAGRFTIKFTPYVFMTLPLDAKKEGEL